jgi:phenylalanyl-tRNA synthetase beta chain
MKVLLSWLRDFAPFDAPVERIGHDLSMLGMAVEDEVHLGRGLDGIVVARVLELRQHPDAKKIQRVTVDAGGADPVEVWCGAFNMAVGDLVPLATVGTTMPNGMEIGRRKILGEYSNGMLCSPKELELSEEGGGILILPNGSSEPGTPVKDALGVEEDVLWDLEINPNRPDAMSVAGVARDLAAKHGLPFTLPSYDVKTVDAGDAVRLQAPDLCGRFTTTVFHGVAIGPSPDWLARRLSLLGMRPINNVVDVSNYVMLELGQPNHPYDLTKVPGGVLGTRRARGGETMTTLDDVERRFTPDDLLIVDADDGAIGVAGVMGGQTTEIDDATTDLLVEMAWFQPLSVSKTARRLGLRTEASARFEKGCDPEGIERAVGRFAELLGVAPEATADVRGELPAREPVRLRTARLNRLLGTALTPEEVRAELEPIGFDCRAAGDGGTDTDVVVPSWRPDTAVEVDLVEEVARHWGYDRIGAAVPPNAHFRPGSGRRGRQVRAGRRRPRRRGVRLVRGEQLGPLARARLPAQRRLLARTGLVGDRARRAQPRGRGAVVERQAPPRLRRPDRRRLDPRSGARGAQPGRGGARAGAAGRPAIRGARPRPRWWIRRRRTPSDAGRAGFPAVRGGRAPARRPGRGRAPRACSRPGGARRPDPPRPAPG